ncbi:MAG: hypothetical protein K6F28_00140 [Lachnospiraceae bacterium]|nr:hypothetical protein [Lachnospiraceae bacterium]
MSDRDKKLLVYLGALIILAGAYFLVGKPFLDKIDTISNEKTQLQSELAAKREAYENKATYEQGIVESDDRIQKILDRFPEDNTDEKTIMFVVNAEKEIPTWVPQINFAEVTENSIAGQSASDVEAQAAQEAVDAVDEAESGETADSVSPESSPMESEEGVSGRGDESGSIRDLVVKDTEIGLKFTSQYDGFKKWLAYLKDYEDRIVIKNIDVTYDPLTELVDGSMVLSQYALLGPGRVLPPVETGVEDAGKENIFVEDGNRPSIIDLIGKIASDLMEAIMGDRSESLESEEEDYFINVTKATDNTNAKTIGRAKDPSGTTYITSDVNKREGVTFTLKGSDGKYVCEYELGDYKVSDDEFQKDKSEKVVLRIISSSRSDKKDKSSIDLHLINESDIPLVVNIENDDGGKARIYIVDTEGDITINR